MCNALVSVAYYIIEEGVSKRLCARAQHEIYNLCRCVDSGVYLESLSVACLLSTCPVSSAPGACLMLVFRLRELTFAKKEIERQ